MTDFQKLIALFKIFDGMPELLAQKLMQFNCLNSEFIKNVAENNHIVQELNKPYFKTLQELHTFYDKFFKSSDMYLPEAKHDVLNTQLKNAVDSENYKLASCIKKYMLLMNVEIKKI